jgi:ABC-type transport system involved in multi-copper enzyme maturation permease subunit
VRKIIAISNAVVADALRRKIVYIVLAFAVFMAVAIPRLPSYGVGVVESVFREVALALTYAAAVVVALSLSANLVPSQVERRTVYNVLGRDVRRWQYLVGSWLGVFAVMGITVAAFAAVNLLVGAVTYHQVMWRLLEGALAIWLETGVIAAFAVMVSTVIGPVPVVVASLAFVFVGHLSGGPQQTAGVLKASALIPSLETFNVINPVAHGAGVSLGYDALMLAVAGAWVGILLIFGMLLFDKRDL